jgi:hypothetical protein
MLWPPLDFVLGDSGFRDVAIVKEPLELATGNGFHLRIDCRYPLHHGSEGGRQPVCCFRDGGSVGTRNLQGEGG